MTREELVSKLPEKPESQELQSLLFSLNEGLITEAESQRLDALLSQNDDAVSEYVRQISMYADLHSRVAASAMGGGGGEERSADALAHPGLPIAAGTVNPAASSERIGARQPQGNLTDTIYGRRVDIEAQPTTLEEFYAPAPLRIAPPKKGNPIWHLVNHLRIWGGIAALVVLAVVLSIFLSRERQPSEIASIIATAGCSGMGSRSP